MKKAADAVGDQPRRAQSLPDALTARPSATRYGFTVITNKRTWSKAS